MAPKHSVSSVSIPLPPTAAEHGSPCRILIHAGGTGSERHGLMIGNSLTFYHAMPANLGCLLTEVTGIPHAISFAARGGVDLAWHRDLGYAVALLASFPHWDFVIFQDQSRRPADHPEDSGVDFSHYFSMARTLSIPAIGYATWDIQEEEPIASAIQTTIEEAARCSGASVAKVGASWARYLRKHSAEDLYLADRKHPTPCGSLLAAAALAHHLAGDLPSELPDYWADSGGGLISVSAARWHAIREAVSG